MDLNSFFDELSKIASVTKTSGAYMRMLRFLTGYKLGKDVYPELLAAEHNRREPRRYY